jgi:tyrosyl-tRNA synthetase
VSSPPTLGKPSAGAQAELSQSDRLGVQAMMLQEALELAGSAEIITAASPPLSAEQVAANAQTYPEQVKPILDMSKVEVVNNVDWLTKVDLIKLAALVTANQLLAKDAFGTRLEQNLPLGLHELLYPLLQGFDSVQVMADVEIGGTDQRFNILMGRHLQPHFQQKPQLAMLLPLLLGIDGVRKMSKSFGNAIGLTDSPDQIFTKVMSIGDQLIVPFFTLVTN